MSCLRRCRSRPGFKHSCAESCAECVKDIPPLDRFPASIGKSTARRKALDMIVCQSGTAYLPSCGESLAVDADRILLGTVQTFHCYRVGQSTIAGKVQPFNPLSAQERLRRLQVCRTVRSAAPPEVLCRSCSRQASAACALLSKPRLAEIYSSRGTRCG